MNAPRRRSTSGSLALLAAIALTIGVAPNSAIADSPTITVSGHVSLGDTGTSAGLDDVGISYRIWQPQWFTTSVVTKTDADGDYSLTLPSPAIVAINFTYLGAGNYVDGTTSDAMSPLDPELLYTTDTPGVDYTLLAGATIAGTITDTAGTPQGGVTAIAHPAGSSPPGEGYEAVSNSSGDYSITGLPPGDYRVEFYDGRPNGTGPGTQQFFRQWWEGSAGNPQGAPPFALAAGGLRAGVDAELVRGATERVRLDCDLCGSSSLRNVVVLLRLELKDESGDWQSVRSDQIFLPTVYGAFLNLYPGTYRLRVQTEDPRLVSVLVPEFVLDEQDSRLDTVFIPISDAYGGSISGTVTTEIAGASIEVRAYRQESATSWRFAGSSEADPLSGDYLITSLRAGSYTIYFSDESGHNVSEWYDDERVELAAESFTVSGTSATADIDAFLTADGPTAATTRVSGADRYETSAEIARSFTSTGGVIYVASGQGFADALSAAPAAARWGGPLLLTQREILPDVIRAQIERLRPHRIVVVGGTGAIAPTVFNELAALSYGETVRIGGANRYETSRAIAEDAFGTLGGGYAFIATGRNFPDALSAAAAAANWHAPVILVDGANSSLDPATNHLLTGLNLYEAFIAGGTGVVSTGIEHSLDLLGLSEPPERFGGANRYETSYLINQRFFGGADSAYFATGTGFADALSGAALAAHEGGPLYLVHPDCVPPSIIHDVDEIDADLVTLLGGIGALTKAVERFAPCAA